MMTYLRPGAGVHHTLESLLPAEAGVQSAGQLLDTRGMMHTELHLPGHRLWPKPVIRAAHIVPCMSDVQ